MNISYRSSLDGITAESLVGGFFEGWPNPPSPEAHLRILKGSFAVELALDPRSNRVIGFINAISDGVCSAYLPLLEVLPDYRKQGIASVLVGRMLDRLQGLYMIDLACDEAIKPFYRRHGFVELGAMARRNYERQSCG